MTLVDLKDQIKNYQLTPAFFIFLYKDNTFLVNSYIDAICEQFQIDKQVVDSIYAQESALSLIMPVQNTLHVVYVEEFSEFCENYEALENTIVVCNKIDKKLQKFVEDFVVEFPKLADWQIKDYMHVKCPELSDSQITWLYSVTKGDIYRITNELDKILLFPENDRTKVLSALEKDPASDLFSFEFFEFVDAILFSEDARNKDIICNYLKHQKACVVNSFSLVNSLFAKAKNTLLTLYCPNLTPEETGVSSGQAYYIRTGRAPDLNRLRRLINVLSSFDLKVKSGELDLSNERQIDYILTQLVS